MADTEPRAGRAGNLRRSTRHAARVREARARVGADRADLYGVWRTAQLVLGQSE
jgi:hypothetical protein